MFSEDVSSSMAGNVGGRQQEGQRSAAARIAAVDAGRRRSALSLMSTAFTDQVTIDRFGKQQPTS